MLIDTEIAIPWSGGAAISHYLKLGYPPLPHKTIFWVKITDLLPNSLHRVKVQCTICSVVKTATYANYRKAVATELKYCCNKCSPTKRKKQVAEVQALFTSAGLTPLFTDYHNNKENLDYTCQKHPLIIQRMRLDTLLNYGPKCQFCTSEIRSESKTGNKNIFYKDGTTAIKRHLRVILGAWKKEVLTTGKYTCAVSNKVGGRLHIHHLEPFSVIVENAHRSLGIGIKERVKDYTIAELSALDAYVLAAHKTARAVILCTTVHTLFHSMYGSTTFNEGDYLEFKTKYQQGVL